MCIAAGAPGITVHPRADRRHITPDDVREIARALRERPAAVEFNIEGDPRPDLLDLVDEVRPISARSCPLRRAKSPARRAGGPDRDRARSQRSVERLQARGVRVSLFVDP